MTIRLLSSETFEFVVQNTPLVSIDLILRPDDNSVLLGKRNNPPAKDYWFAPGGRILKNETLDQAMHRIFEKELGVPLHEICHFNPELLGVYEHFYDDCFSGSEGVSTHYVVIAFSLLIQKKFTTFVCDEQHSTLEWWNVDNLLISPHVHQYTKNYFKSN